MDMPAVKSRPKLRLKLEAQIDMILSRPTLTPPPREPLPSAFDPQPEVPVTPPPRLDVREPFGCWLIAQRDRGDWVDALADAARKDSRFPRNGSPDDVRKHLNAMQAEGDMFEAIDDAELGWLSL
jgi:hypothetical protein